MCHSQIEGDKDEQDRDEQEMKEREIFGSSSLSKLRQKNRLIFAFMLKVLNFFWIICFQNSAVGLLGKAVDLLGGKQLCHPVPSHRSHIHGHLHHLDL